MSCHCSHKPPAGGSSAPRAALQVNEAALRQVLGIREYLAYMTAVAGEQKAVGRIKVNTEVIWRHYTTSVYASGDLPIIATREALQNSVDAIRAAVRAGSLKEGRGEFRVAWDAAAHSLTWEDNGIGMDTQTILDKFLSLGDSGKRESGGSKDAAGGFGVAKAVILGVSETFRWELHSRDNLARPDEMGEIPIVNAPVRAGTRITVYDVPRTYDEWWDHIALRPVLSRLRLLLGACDLAGIALYVNGEKVKPLFRLSGGAPVAHGSFGSGTEARVRAYRRSEGGGGGYYVRLGGLYQFHRGAFRVSDLPVDVVLDLTTVTRPGEAGYPLTVGRDSLKGAADEALRQVALSIEKEAESAGDSREYEEYDPEEGATDPELEAAAAEALGDLDLRESLAAAGEAAQRFFATYADGTERGESSDAPRATPGERREPEGPSFSVASAAVSGPAPSSPDGSRASDRAAAVEVLKVFLGNLGAAAPAVAAAVAGEGPLDEATAGVLLSQVEQRVEAAMAPGGAGLVAAAAAPAAAEAIWALGGRVAARPNPFGRYAALKISLKNYDRTKARRFKQGFRRWVPYLLLWDLTLRAIARVGRIQDRFTPGFVLDDTADGLTARKNGRVSVLVHPDRLKAVAQANKATPALLAHWLHTVGCHELSHVDTGNRGHDETFVARRESLGRSTAALLPTLEEAAVKILRLHVPPSPLERALADCRRTLLRRQVPQKGRALKNVSLAKTVLAELERTLTASPPPGFSSAFVSTFFRAERAALLSALADLEAP